MTPDGKMMKEMQRKKDRHSVLYFDKAKALLLFSGSLHRKV